MKIQKTEVFSATFQICASKSKHFRISSYLIITLDLDQYLQQTYVPKAS